MGLKMRVSSPTPGSSRFEYLSGGNKATKCQTGQHEIDVEISILQRCIERLRNKKYQYRDGCLLKPNNRHAALSPYRPPTPPQEYETVQLEDNSTKYFADGSARPRLAKTRMRKLLSQSWNLSPASEVTHPSPAGDTDKAWNGKKKLTYEEILHHQQGSQESRPYDATPDTPFRTHIEVRELELELDIMQKTLAALVAAVSSVSTSGQAASSPPPSEKDETLTIQTYFERFQSSRNTSSRATSPAIFSTTTTVPGPSTEFPDTPIVENVSTEETHNLWDAVLPYCKFGVGSYEFKLQQVGNRLQLCKESTRYHLESVADELFNFTKLVLKSQEVPFQPDKVVSTREKTAGRHCKGIVHYIGSKYGSEPFQNPATMPMRALIDVQVSSCFSLGRSPDVVNCSMGYFVTQDKPGSWVFVDFRQHAVVPVYYSFASAHPIYSGFYPRNWELQGSLDSKDWTTLKKHVDDCSIDRFNPIGYWKIDGDNVKFYRYFRIQQTGVNSFGTHELQMSSFEVYGQVIFIIDDKPYPAPSPSREPQRSRSPSPPPPVPPAPKAVSKKKKK